MKKENYLIAFSLTSFIFIVGVLIGSMVSSSRIDEIQKKLQEDVLDTQSLELELIVTGQNRSICNYLQSRLPEIVRRKAELGRKFDVEDVNQAQQEIFYKQYVISLARYWIFTNLQEKQCTIRTPTILFFFEQNEASREQGRALDYLVFKSNETLNVISFNTAIPEPLVRLIVEQYNVTETPAMVIGQKKYEGFIPANDLSRMLCDEYNVTC